MYRNTFHKHMGSGVDLISSGASGGSLHGGESFKVEKAHFTA